MEKLLLSTEISDPCFQRECVKKCPIPFISYLVGHNTKFVVHATIELQLTEDFTISPITPMSFHSEKHNLCRIHYHNKPSGMVGGIIFSGGIDLSMGPRVCWASIESYRTFYFTVILICSFHKTKMSIKLIQKHRTSSIKVISFRTYFRQKQIPKRNYNISKNPVRSITQYFQP